MEILVVSNVGKAYKRYARKWSRVREWLTDKPNHEKNWVLRDLNFSVNRGESVGILGVNGAGKSTLLKIITGTTQPTTGSVTIHGRVAALLELGMGFHPDFTGRQNIFIAGQLLGLRSDEIAANMNNIEAFAEIGDYIDRPVRTYSSGMQMRLAFSVATAVRPDVLIVDEALSVGDAYFQAKCFQRIAYFKEQGMTLLLVSHSPGDVVKHCERAILLKDGRIEQDGSSRSVTNVYLDELFGRKKDIGTQSSVVAEDSAQKLVSGGNLDVFHTRPGYHKQEHRWGHGGAVILDYIFSSNGEDYSSRLESNSVTDFYFKVRFESDFDSVVPGFLIKTLEGIFLYGTNSFVSTGEEESISVSAGEIKIFQFSLPLSLNEGHYMVSFGISSGLPLQELTPLDRRYDALMINIGRPQKFWGIVDLKASFHCHESKSEAFVA
ncbi:ABC transporter ATP-binding protein [Delftia sp. RIT313]|uniref:ABC transporter ATP-binding protein n=1 Tax=Delftia sp. RIT313 TaxID=1468410 RepID=UPI000445F4FB|nr:ABC transporter ATP-binding protein [Delftia sp. RIT313]EZP53997.1 Lipopolysaccharide transport system ATP-binding protein [Delftia sp. RIT313]